MASKREEKRQDLKSRLIEAAAKRIAEHGLQGLRARDVTSDAGCALGSLYTVFGDLDELVVHVNSRTLGALGKRLQTAADQSGDPATLLKALSHAYYDFATEHPRLWSALFEIRLADGKSIPDWHQEEQEVLIRHIAAPLSQLQPHLTAETLAIRARLYFAAVHGIVSIQMEDRFTRLPSDLFDSELDGFIDTVVAGLK